MITKKPTFKFKYSPDIGGKWDLRIDGGTDKEKETANDKAVKKAAKIKRIEKKETKVAVEKQTANGIIQGVLDEFKKGEEEE